MTNEDIPGDVRNVWQDQSPVFPPVSLDELRLKAGNFRGQIERRNLREYVVSALLIVFFGYCAWTSRPALIRAGNGLLIAGLVYMMYQLHRRGAAARNPGELGWNTCVAFHRAELERQRDALSGVWKWYLGPMVPGLAAIEAAGCIAGFRRSTLAGLLALVYPLFVGAAFWWIARLNRSAAGRLQQQIDALNDSAARLPQ